MSALEDAQKRISAFILPRRAVTEAEISALGLAAQAQVSYESEFKAYRSPSGLKSFKESNDGVSVNASHRQDDWFFCLGLAPTARAILVQAGLIKSGLPVARRL